MAAVFDCEWASRAGQLPGCGVGADSQDASPETSTLARMTSTGGNPLGQWVRERRRPLRTRATRRFSPWTALLAGPRLASLGARSALSTDCRAIDCPAVPPHHSKWHRGYHPVQSRDPSRRCGRRRRVRHHVRIRGAAADCRDRQDPPWSRDCPSRCCRRRRIRGHRNSLQPGGCSGIAKCVR